MNAISKMPVLFVGHGSPMNAIEDNEFTQGWRQITAGIPRPRAILVISAHWFTRGSRVNDTAHPRQVYDMYGFPPELYRLSYPALGAPELARRVRGLLGRPVQADNTWGIDHGAWSVLCRMYPGAEIPVVQLSIDAEASPEKHFQMGRELSALREEGVLILGSGNVVHNLGRIGWEMPGGYPWAYEFDAYIKARIQSKHYDDIVYYQRAGQSAEYAFPTPEHFYPLLYALGAAEEYSRLTVFNEASVMGSLSMTCYLLE